MSHPSGAVNRSGLLVVGIVALVGGAAALAVGTGTWSTTVGALTGWPSPKPGASLGGGVRALLPGTTWIVVAAAVAGALLLVIGLSWLVSLIPRRRDVGALTVDDGSDGTTTIDQRVLCQALEADCETSPDVHRARIQLTGDPARPQVVATVTLFATSDVSQALRELRQRLHRQLDTVLDVRPASLAVRVEVTHEPNRQKTVVL